MLEGGNRHGGAARHGVVYLREAYEICLRAVRRTSVVNQRLVGVRFTFGDLIVYQGWAGAALPIRRLTRLVLNIIGDYIFQAPGAA